eukprot:8275417-Pyramimonas_sp.AAC.1
MNRSCVGSAAYCTTVLRSVPGSSHHACVTLGVTQLEWKNLPHVQRRLLVRSVQQRRVDMLLITDPTTN